MGGREVNGENPQSKGFLIKKNVMGSDQAGDSHFTETQNLWGSLPLRPSGKADVQQRLQKACFEKEGEGGAQHFQQGN